MLNENDLHYSKKMNKHNSRSIQIGYKSANMLHVKCHLIIKKFLLSNL